MQDVEEDLSYLLSGQAVPGDRPVDISLKMESKSTH